jgi:hypothetical protein
MAILMSGRSESCCVVWHPASNISWRCSLPGDRSILARLRLEREIIR